MSESKYDSGSAINKYASNQNYKSVKVSNTT